MRAYCKTPLTLEMWHIKTPETMTDCNMSCVRHDFHNFLDTSILVKKNCRGGIRYHVVCMGVTFSYTQEKTVIFYMLKLLLYEAGTKI